MISLVHDLRYAIRQLRKNPGFTVVVVITLALGIGANTAIFTFLNAVMLRSAPVHDPAHLVAFKWTSRNDVAFHSYSSFEPCFDEATSESNSNTSVIANSPPAWGHCSFSYPAFQSIRSQAGVFSDVTAFAGPASLVLAGNGAATIMRGELVSGDFFHALGVSTALGRVLGAGDDAPGAEGAVVLSYSYWQKAFGGASSAVGRTIRLNGVTVTIVGVADRQFTELSPGRTSDMWLPLSLGQRLAINWFPHDTNDPESWWLELVARTKPGVSLRQAQAAANTIFSNEMLHGSSSIAKTAVDPAIVLAPIQHGLIGMREAFSKPLYVLMASVGLLLLIACANIAGLTLARSSPRQREIAVRLTLGASRLRVVRQLLTESILLAAMGGALGAWLAYFGARSLASFVTTGGLGYFELHLGPDVRVLAFTTAASVLTGVVFGLAPASGGTGVELAPALKQSAGSVTPASSAGKRHLKPGNILVIAQVALSVVVLVAAGLLVRTLMNLRNMDPGFDTHNLLLFGIDPTLNGYKEPQIQALYNQLEYRLSALPGVVSASYSYDSLLSGSIFRTDIRIEGSKETSLPVDILGVGPRFFETLRIPLVEGRTFTSADLESTQPLAVVNRAFARRYLPSRNPLAARFGETDPNPKTKPWEIVGVVGDARYAGLQGEIRPTAYVVFKGGGAHFEVRTKGNAAALISSVRKVVSEVDNGLPLFAVRTQSEQIDQILFNQRLVARLSSLFGILALLLASIGLYGLLSYEVGRRTRELGLRMALGAQQRDVTWLVVGQGIGLIVIGLAIGTMIAALLTRYLSTLLYGVKPIDVPVFFGVVLLLLTVALIAAYIPARRAAKVDPMVALRYE